jgi:hypothetical protein
MTNKEALEYGLKNARPLGYVKGPIYVDGITNTLTLSNITWTEEVARSQLEQAQMRLKEVETHMVILNRIKAAVLTNSLPDADALEYLLKYLDHPEAGNYHSQGHSGLWDRVKSEQVRKQAGERIAKIEEWECAEKQLKAMTVQILAPDKPVQTDQWGNQWVDATKNGLPFRIYL